MKALHYTSAFLLFGSTFTVMLQFFYCLYQGFVNDITVIPWLLLSFALNPAIALSIVLAGVFLLVIYHMTELY
jgi:hypothetical protein